MTGDQTVGVIASVMMLVLVASSLVARRIPAMQVAKMALGWVTIFGLVFIGFTYRSDLAGVAKRLRAEVDPAAAIAGEDGSLRIRKAEDGHFRVRGSVNGIVAEFLVDSGATTNAISDETARAAGIGSGGRSVEIATAGGLVSARLVRIERLVVGPFVRENIAVVTAPEFGDVNALGMNFLSSLSGWEVEGDWLVLKP